MKICLPEFALSHFDATRHLPAIPGCTPAEFEKQVNDRVCKYIFNGYASFCKLLFYENWTEAQVGILPITPEVEPFIRTEYEARRETELPVLMRYVPGELVNKKAKYLCVIVYDKEQMAKEGTQIDGDYGIVNILRLMTAEEPPLPPITMMRNALGVSEGGSGVPLDREKYKASIEFWRKHVAVKPAALIDEATRLRNAIRNHQEKSGHNLCWENDLELWKAIDPNAEYPHRTVPSKEEFLTQCARYHESRVKGLPYVAPEPETHAVTIEGMRVN